MKQDLEQHLLIEEEQVFPLIEEYAKRNSLEALQQARQEVSKLEAEHRALDELLKRMRLLTSGYSLPDNSCKVIALTYAAMERLEAKLLGHIYVENTFLFPRIKSH
ncbi:Iron-sulfur cluster repair protein YtfE [compost metagenome]